MIKLEAAELAAKIKQEVKAEIAGGLRATLAAVRVGDDPASAVYVKNKIRACEEVGIRSEHHAVPESTSEGELLDLVRSLNTRDDVDGFHPVNAGKLAMGRPVFVPCTPAGIMELLDDRGVEIRGVNACVVGRSQIVGRPMAQLLLQRDATVTICHSRTRDLAAVTGTADLLVVAIGRAGFIRGEHIKPGATVIDVGMNRVSDPEEVRMLFGSEAEKRLEVLEKRGATLVGDVNPSEAAEIAGMLTPVPGGVGLLTVAMLMKNTLKAAKLRRGVG